MASPPLRVRLRGHATTERSKPRGIQPAETESPAKTGIPFLNSQRSTLNALFLLLFLLPACGFTPVYAGREAAPHFAAVAVSPIPGRDGHALKTALESRLLSGRAAPLYRLDIALTRTPRPVIIEQDGRVRRFDALLTAQYALVSLADGAAVTSGTVKRIASYNVIDADFSTFMAEQEAGARAATEIAEAIRQKLAGVFAQKG